MKQVLIELPISVTVYLLMSVGGVLRLFNKQLNYAVMVPVTSTSVVLMLFLFGTLDQLNLGVYFVTTLCLGIYLMAFIILTTGTIRNGIDYLTDSLRLLFSPYAFLLFVFMIVMTYANVGKLVAEWDDFSHWATVVKHMTFYNTLGYDKNSSYVYFKSYPPAMALFQYLVQRIVIWWKPGVKFSEWHLFFAYQMFAVSFLMPFVGRLNFRSPYAWICSVFLVLTMKTIHPSPMSSLLIDPFLGLISGAGLAMVFLGELEPHPVYKFLILLTISIIVLTKDAGMLFAVIILLSFVGMNWHTIDKRSVRSLSCYLYLPIMAVAIPKSMWMIGLWKNDAHEVFSRVDWLSFFKVIFGEEESYRKEVVLSFIRRSVQPYTYVTFFGRSLPVLLLLATLLGISFLMCVVFGRSFPLKRTMFYTIFFEICFCVLCFSFGLLLVYMYKLTPEEGRILHSYERYMSILVYQLIFFIVLSAVAIAENISVSRVFLTALLVGFSIFTGAASAALHYCARAPVWYANELRKQYTSFFEKVERKTSENSVIYFISQGNDGYEFWCARFCLMPRIVNPYSMEERTWTIGSPQYENDQWTMRLTAEEWREMLHKCDYVALYRVNDRFHEDFSCLFEDPSIIAEQSLYRVDKRTQQLGLLRWVE